MCDIEGGIGHWHVIRGELGAERTAAAAPEIFAALISPLRYCGLLEASAAAHQRAIALESKIRTSVVEADIAAGRLVAPFDTVLPQDAGYYVVAPEATAAFDRIARTIRRGVRRRVDAPTRGTVTPAVLGSPGWPTYRPVLPGAAVSSSK